MSEIEVAATHGGAGGLSRADCLCPVCLEIFLEPVTLPCAHTFCKPCFLETVDKANLCCPLCRKRVSTWARHNGRNKTLVNGELWRRVQAAFPMQCQRRLSGQEEEDEGTSVPRPKVCQPGELRREYEDQISKLAEEKRALEEAERKASEEYIQRLLAEEEERLAEERRRQEERQLEDDEKMARLLSQELNPSPISESQRNPRPNEITPAKKKTNPNAGDIEKFLSPVSKHVGTTETSPSSSFVANKENILYPEKKAQSPKEPPEPSMPRLDFYGRPEGPRTQCVATTSTGSTTHHSADPPHTSPKRGSSKKRKSSDVAPSGEVEVFSKRSCPVPSAPWCGEGSRVPEDPPLLQELAQREEDLFSRRQQEDEDRRLALMLQRQLDKEEALRAVDRRKGSGDQYQLRQKRKPSQSHSPGPETATQSGTNRGRSRSSTAKQEKDTAGRSRSAPTPRGEGSSTASAPPCPAASSNPLRRGSKQATLKDMFPSLGS